MLFRRKNTIRIGKVVRELRLRRSFLFHYVRWRFKRVFFKTMKINLSRMLNPHIVIVGESGSGKSSACKVILQQLSALGMNFIVFDAHEEYLGLADALGADVYDASRTGINLFETGDKSDKEKAGEVSGMLKRLLGLGRIQAYVLYKAILYTYKVARARGSEPGVGSLLFTIRVFEKHASGSELNVLRSLEHRLSPLAVGSFSNCVDVGKLVGRRSIFAMGRIATSEAQAVYMESFLRQVYSAMLGWEKRSTPRLFLVMEEAGRLGEGSVLARLVAEGRKYGIGIIAIAQRAKALDREIRANAELLVAFYQREPEELNYTANIISGGNEYDRFTEVKRAMRNLRRGSAMVVKNMEEPAIVRFGRCGLTGRSLTMEIMRLLSKAVGERELLARLAESGFEEEEIKERLKELTANGTVGSYVIPGGGCKGAWYLYMPRNSAEHDIMVSLISRHLTAIGIRNTVYNTSFGPDIVAYEGRERIAVEYETGSKGAEATKMMLENRKKQYGKTLLVVNDAFYPSYSGLEGVEVFRASEFLEFARSSSVGLSL